MKNRLFATTVVTASALVLVSCSANTNTFTFERPGAQATSAITVNLPEDMIDGTAEAVLTSFTATSVPNENDNYCTIKLEFTYAGENPTPETMKQESGHFVFGKKPGETSINYDSEGRYISDDMKTGTVVEKCTDPDIPSDGEKSEIIKFQQKQTGADPVQLASLEISSSQDGTISIAAAKLHN